MPYLSAEAKGQLSKTVRTLRDRLLTDLRNGVEQAYRLKLKTTEARLPEAAAAKRTRLETWLAEQVRAETGLESAPKGSKAAAQWQGTWERHLLAAIKLAGATLLNRLVVLRQMEAQNLMRSRVLTRGWDSRDYREFRSFAPDLCQDDSEGYGLLLGLLYDELALDLPGLFGRVGVTELIPIPASTLRAVVEALEALDPDIWLDDTTLGWVYQYWNDPEREALDDKLNGGGKVEPHEIASKTQMFTERYMVEWLLHNSLGQQWLAICQHNGWTPEVVADGTLDRLEKRRQDWRAKRDRGEVALDALMPIESAQEERWKYWVKQPPLSPQPPNPLLPEEKGEQENAPAPLSPGRGAGGEGNAGCDMPSPASVVKASTGSGPQPPNPLLPEEKGEQENASAPLSPGRGAGGEGSIRHLKILDPACGSGHFLIIAFGLLFAFYQEEARHRGETWTDREIVESILAHNLHGLDLDPRAVQIAAAALYLKAKALCPEAELTVLNLVASNLNLAALPEDDPALVELRREVTAATGIPEELTNQIVQGLKGADAWGSLLKVDDEVDRAIATYERQLWKQGELFASDSPLQTGTSPLAPLHSMERGTGTSTSPSPLVERGPGGEVKTILIAKLERFLTLRTRGDDLGLRLRGEQLAAGVRFLRLVREGAYDLVIGNPPYQGTSKMKDAKYVAQHYKRSKSDLFAVFLERAQQLLKPGGLSSMITMRNWMFISQYSDLREWLITENDLRALGDVSWGAFSAMKDNPVTMSVIRKAQPSGTAVAIAPTDLSERVRSAEEVRKKIAGLICGTQRYEFQTQRFDVIKEKPIIYWWDREFLRKYAETPKMEDETDVKQGMATANNTRFLRQPWEVTTQDIFRCKIHNSLNSLPVHKWVPYVKGAAGKAWFEPISELLLWHPNALAVKLMERDGEQASRPQNEHYYFRSGIAFTSTGNDFKARCHRFRSVFDVKGQSVFPKKISNTVCLMNSGTAQEILVALNPSISFQVGDARRLPLFPIESADEIFAKLDRAFTEHEAARETSVEFQQPGPSCWAYAQAWAQQAVDRPPGAPLPDWQPQYDQPPAVNWVSYAVGLALGRFPLSPHPLTPSPQGEGEPEVRPPSPSGRGTEGEGTGASDPHPLTPSPQGEGEPDLLLPSPSGRGAGGEGLPHGILYLSAYSGDRPESPDTLAHPACQPLHTAWAEYGGDIAPGKTLRDWLRLNFFKEVHVGLYEQRPIYFPLSSEKKHFVAFIAIHRWADNTLTTLLADHLIPEQIRLDGEVADLMETKALGDRKNQAIAEKRYGDIMQLKVELDRFIQLVRQCADSGPPPAKASDPPPEATAPYRMDLDDGVMINSAALWPLLDPQWPKPKTWWSELCTAKGRKDYDWAHLAARYFPQRVDGKCQRDPSLAVAHGCFWRYHPAKAYEWELRLQDEIGPDFTLDEADADTLRQQFEANHPQTVAELREKEQKRRDRKYKKQAEDQLSLEVSSRD